MISRFIVPTVLVAALYGFVQLLGWQVVLALLAAVLLTVSALLIVFQEKLLYIPVVMGYRTVLDNPPGYRSPEEHGFSHTDFYVDTPDGEKIHGWHIRPSGSAVCVVLFCHENAGNIGLRVTNLVAMSARLSCEVVCFDYRGYGHSSGRPSESGLVVDTETVYQSLRKSTQLPIFVYGRSLGGAVAIQWAAKYAHTISGLIVENTFTSISDMVGSIFPFLNFSFVKRHLLRLRWDSAHWIKSVSCPLLLLAGEKDEIVPFVHMMKLKEFTPNSQFVTFPTGSHNDTWVVGGDRYWSVMRAFVHKAITKQ